MGVMVLFVPKLERQIGIEVYATRSLGIGGVIRQSLEDFVVEEVLVDGSKASIVRSGEHQVLGSSPVPNRYLLCVLIKRNWDTFSAVKAVADQLGISMARVNTGGIKDAKAVTAQHITIEGAFAEEIQKVHIKDLEIRPIGYFRNRFSSYYLLGNSFHIAINSVSHAKSVIEKRIAQTVADLRSLGGVPNFFGYQRFGTTRPITHLVGKAIIKGNFRKAAMLFLAKPSPHEHPESRRAREVLQTTQDFKQAYEDFPKQLRYERLMLKQLAEEPADYIGAFKRLPIKLQELFIQAYQSYLFNKFLSRRIASGLGLSRAEIGDYVVNVENSGLPMQKMRKIASAETLTEINEAIGFGKMRLALPLIGFKQSTSQGVQGEIEKQILGKEDVQPRDFKVRAMPKLPSKGELRTAMIPLNDFSLDNISSDSAISSKYKVRLNFTLLRGSYATVVLRELMKPRNPVEARF
jgi:tRNA pseudouridine13 synthase